MLAGERVEGAQQVVVRRMKAGRGRSRMLKVGAKGEERGRRHGVVGALKGLGARPTVGGGRELGGRSHCGRKVVDGAREDAGCGRAKRAARLSRWRALRGLRLAARDGRGRRTGASGRELLRLLIGDGWLELHGRLELHVQLVDGRRARGRSVQTVRLVLVLVLLPAPLLVPLGGGTCRARDQAGRAAVGTGQGCVRAGGRGAARARARAGGRTEASHVAGLALGELGALSAGLSLLVALLLELMLLHGGHEDALVVASGRAGELLLLVLRGCGGRGQLVRIVVKVALAHGHGRTRVAGGRRRRCHEQLLLLGGRLQGVRLARRQQVGGLLGALLLQVLTHGEGGRCGRCLVVAGSGAQVKLVLGLGQELVLVLARLLLVDLGELALLVLLLLVRHRRRVRPAELAAEHLHRSGAQRSISGAGAILFPELGAPILEPNLDARFG